MNKQILRLAIPNIISNITVPLLAMVDIAIAGRLESSLYIGAIALGTMIFNIMYWNLGFIRMGTSGFTSQAYGAENLTEIANLLLRSLLVALGFGVLIILLQIPIFNIAKLFIKTDGKTIEYVGKYFFIAVWSAPAMLSMYAFNGWFIGMQNAKIPMYVAIINNLFNIFLSYFFVYHLNMQIEGIALGTMLSQFTTLFIFIIIYYLFYGKELKKYYNWNEVLKLDAFKDFFRVNTDIFIRTILLVLVTTFFTFASTNMGNDILAVNTLLMQFFMLFSYFMDGLAYAGEALTGKFIGRKNQESLNKMLKTLFTWGIGLSFLASVIYLFFTPNILSILTDKQEVILLAQEFTFWVVIVPIVGFATFIWDGIYVGATASKAMRNSMIIATVMFFMTYYSLFSIWQNNGLWLAFILYLVGRSVMQTIYAKKAIRVKF